MSVIQSIFPTHYQIRRVDDNGSRYYACPTGDYPSITTVLSCRGTSWLSDWIAAVGPDQAASVSKKACSIGTTLHALCEKYLLNESIKVDLIRAMPEAKLRFKNFRSFLDDISEVFLLERPVYSTYLKVAGTVDCFAVYKGKPCVIDFKTANRPKTVDDIKGYFAQATFYAYAIAELYNVPVPSIVIAIAVNGVKEPLIFESKAHLHLDYLIETIRMHKNGESD